MFHESIKKITNCMRDRHVIEDGMYEVYQYGLELLVSGLITFTSIMVIACLADSFLIGILYFIVSDPLKVTAGGYHASTYLKCFIVSNLEYLILSAAAKALSALFMPAFVWIALLLASSSYILANCPVRNPHHPVSEDVIRKNRRLAFLLLGIDCAVIIVSYLLLQQSYLLNFMVLSITSVAVFILPVKLKRKERGESL
ncbi:MAG TPA: hypothetical protein DCZ40_10785 [Lachnospiraceae bacterium]|nr:hypothetical protein [Lachnospiraceae bacterium]